MSWDKAGWLKKKKPGKPWTTDFCVVRTIEGRTVFELYRDDNIQDERVRPRATFDLLGATLEARVPSTLLEGSQDAHQGTDQYSFMIKPRAVGKRPQERHVFKAMHDEEKVEWLRLLQSMNGSRSRTNSEAIGAPVLARAEDDFDVDAVLSRLETYACLVSFRVQRKFIHLLNSPHEDYASLKTLVLGMVAMSAAMPGHRLEPSSSERHLLGELATLREGDMADYDLEALSDDDESDAAPAGRAGGGAEAPPPASDDSDEDTPPRPSAGKLSRRRQRQELTPVKGFSPSTSQGPDSGLKAPPPLPTRRVASGRARTPTRGTPAKPPAGGAARPPPPAPPPPATPPPPPAPPIGDLSSSSGSRFVPDPGEILMKKAALRRRQTVTRLGGQSVTAARAELAKENSATSAIGDAGGRGGAKRRMSVLMNAGPAATGERALARQLQESMSAYNDWPFMTGWMLKKGRKRTNWKQRWFVLAGPFLMYYDSPESQIAHTVLDDNFTFLKGFTLITNKDLKAGKCEIRSYKHGQVQRTVANHEHCFVLQDTSRELFLDPPPQSARSHSTAEWLRRLRKGIEWAEHVQTIEAGLHMLLAQGSGLAPFNPTLAMQISDACLPRVFRETLPRDQQTMLGAMDSRWDDLPPTLKTLKRPGRYLQRCSLLLRDDQGILEPSGVFLFNDILVYAAMERDAESVPRFTYKGHHSLIDLTLIESGSGENRDGRFSIKVTPQHAQEDTEDAYAEFRQSDTINLICEVPENSATNGEILSLMWQTELGEAIKHAKQPSAKMERFEGAVIFADVSGFSNLGDFLERREREANAGAGATDAGMARTVTGETAAEGLAKFLGNEVEKMVEMVTKGGGDVIKFAGDCVIAVFQAEDYTDLEKDLDYRYSALALATGQAIRVSVEMTNRQRDVVARASEQRFEDEISELVAKLNIHVAIGAGMVYGYHVGGVGRKWEYLIDGPVMQQVRKADEDAGAGEVALSVEAHELVKGIDMRKKRVESGNYLLTTYLGPTKVPKFIRPWETVKGDKKRDMLADLLMQYVATPVVEQVQAGLTTVAQHRTISTAFCRLIGIDYESQEGEVAVMELGAITSQVQLILKKHDGTLTRVISDDKGTSMLIAFDQASQAVQSALEMIRSITSIPVAEGQPPFKTAIGITTGTVWIGCVGGRIRSEYTMHGSHVNFAARLMTCKLIKEIGGVLCDKATHDACDDIAFTVTKPMPFKGFKEELVSYVPHLPGEDPRPLAETLPDRLAVHNQRVGEWEAQLTRVLDRQDQQGRPKKGRGAVVVVQTDVDSHWNMDPLFEAIDNTNRQAMLEPMDRCHIPIAPEMETEVDQDTDDDAKTEQRRKETVRRHARNNKELSQLLADPDLLRSMVYVVERADALSAEGWALLHKLCASKKYLRQPDVHCIIVITLEPPPPDALTDSTGAEALYASNERSIGRSEAPPNWLDLKFIAYSQTPWYDTPYAAESADSTMGEQTGGALPPIPGADGGSPPQSAGKAPPPLPTLAPSSSRAKRTRSVVTVGADRCAHSNGSIAAASERTAPSSFSVASPSVDAS
jgi:class 3 adenylate cyclase